MRTLTYSLSLLIVVSILIVVGILIAAFLTLTNSHSGELTYNSAPSVSNNPPPKYSAFVTNLFTKDTQKAAQATDSFSDWQNSENIKYGEYVADDTSVVISGETNETATSSNVSEIEPTPNDNTFDIWGWIPTTRINAPKVTEQVSPSTKVSKTYANALGDAIKSFTTSAGDQPKVLQDFIEGRGSVGNTTQLIALGDQYVNLSNKLRTIIAEDMVPADIKKRGNDLAVAYGTVGQATKDLAQAETMNDEDTITAIYSYNATIDTFAQDFLAFVNVIGAHGVTFTKGEGGDIFVLLR